jgi:hypothetical protein
MINQRLFYTVILRYEFSKLLDFYSGKSLKIKRFNPKAFLRDYYGQKEEDLLKIFQMKFHSC